MNFDPCLGEFQGTVGRVVIVTVVMVGWLKGACKPLAVKQPRYERAD